MLLQFNKSYQFSESRKSPKNPQCWIFYGFILTNPFLFQVDHTAQRQRSDLNTSVGSSTTSCQPGKTDREQVSFLPHSEQYRISLNCSRSKRDDEGKASIGCGASPCTTGLCSNILPMLLGNKANCKEWAVWKISTCYPLHNVSLEGNPTIRCTQIPEFPCNHLDASNNINSSKQTA